MSSLLWLVPVFPLAGFLVNGIVYLLSHQTEGETHGHEQHPAEAKSHGAPHASAPSAHAPDVAHGAHVAHPKIPFRRLHTLVGTGSVALSVIFAFGAIFDVGLGALARGASCTVRLWTWLPIGIGLVHNAAASHVPTPFVVDAAFRLDALSALMISFVTFVGFLIHVYSIGYMGHEEGYGRYFAYLNLFMFSMLVLVLGANFAVMFVGWEGVGLCSYLLIGYYYEKKFAADAGKKAFVVNRIGDFGFILGIFGIFSLFGTLDFGRVFGEAAAHPNLYAPYLTAVCLALFVGACGKSAQIPLYVWLPDAMAGPTPVSALIHAATMVTAGVYMVVRCNVLFRLAPDAMLVVAIVGGVTAFGAATIGMAQNDIKKVLAYSTVSQLGYMFLGCGVGAFIAGIFHVLTHAFFKACLFLGSGSVIHAMGGEQDMRRMGGLKRQTPITYWTFLIASIAIAGIPPLAGFFSKDAILGAAFERSKPLWLLGLAGAILTAFYMFRAVLMTFHGEFRGTEEQKAHLHESPSTMTIPLIVLAILSVVGGWIGIPHISLFDRFLGAAMLPLHGIVREVQETPWSLELGLMTLSTAVAAAGLVLGVRFYSGKRAGAIPARFTAAYPGVYRTVLNKYYVDEFYDAVLVEGLGKGGGKFLWDFDVRVVDGFVHLVRTVVLAASFLSSLFDEYVVDGLVNGTADTLQLAWRGLRRLQTGQVQSYAYIMAGGLVAVIAAYLLFR
jgi:NADH-quinone oxidoreductase subunit L